MTRAAAAQAWGAVGRVDTARDFVYDSWAHQDRALGGGAAGGYGAGLGQALTWDPEPGPDAEGRSWAGLEAPQVAIAAHCQAPAAHVTSSLDVLGRSDAAADAPGADPDWAQSPRWNPQQLRRPGLEAVDWLLMCNAVLIASTRLKAGCYTELAPSLQLLHAMARALPCESVGVKMLQLLHLACRPPCINKAAISLC